MGFWYQWTKNIWTKIRYSKVWGSIFWAMLGRGIIVVVLPMVRPGLGRVIAWSALGRIGESFRLLMMKFFKQ